MILTVYAGHNHLTLATTARSEVIEEVGHLFSSLSIDHFVVCERKIRPFCCSAALQRPHASRLVAL